MPARQAGRGREQRDAPADTAVPRGQSGCSNGGPGQTDPPPQPVGSLVQVGAAGHPPPSSRIDPGLPPSAEVQEVSEPSQLCPFGSGASPPGTRRPQQSPVAWEQGPRGLGDKPAASWASVCAGKWGRAQHRGPRGPGRGLGAAGELQPPALPLPTGLPFTTPCPRSPFPRGGRVPPKASAAAGQPPGIGAPQNVLLPKRGPAAPGSPRKPARVLHAAGIPCPQG